MASGGGGGDLGLQGIQEANGTSSGSGSGSGSVSWNPHPTTSQGGGNRSTPITPQKTRSHRSGSAASKVTTPKNPPLSRQETPTKSTASSGSYNVGLVAGTGGYRLEPRPYPVWAAMSMISKDDKTNESDPPTARSSSGTSKQAYGLGINRGALDRPVFRYPKLRSETKDKDPVQLVHADDIKQQRNISSSSVNNNEKDEPNDFSQPNAKSTNQQEQAVSDTIPGTGGPAFFDYSPSAPDPNADTELNEKSKMDVSPGQAFDDRDFSEAQPVPYRRQSISYSERDDYKFPARATPSFVIPNNISDNMTRGTSKWQELLAMTARHEFYESQGIIDEVALNRQGDLDRLWKAHVEEERQLRLEKLRRNRISRLGRLRHFFRKQREPDSTHPGNSGRDTEPLHISSARYLVSHESRQKYKPRLRKIFLNNPFIPLTLRATIFILSIIALAVSSSIYKRSHDAKPNRINQQPSTIMAIVVQSTALVYLVYITYDEYSGKPLGLRDARAKMRLIMLDLLFIIFSAANLSLTFNTLYDRTWVCQDFSFSSSSVTIFLPYISKICDLQKVLASFLFMVLVMWILTFTVSIFRLVERVAQ
ncbi:Srf1p [Sugiyamaella lignohabitans]|uniref:Srf1p n=1 Tax=Sugiyamaella lignohabitans TaxID=796027 RepID=A0A167EW58_9ASCO|nr:Srf1p [Sugiyamaella lignohabitans]ANB14534.1 Srf1p [Sugiyamaella lignohabitans]